nr:hypothetical protein [uncultured Methanobrevibacter sp.]
MKRSIVLLILVVALLSISAVAAEGNVTDINGSDDVVLVDANSSDEIDLVKADSALSANDTVGYESFSTQINATLNSNGTALASKPVIFSIDGNNYTRITDSLGNAVLDISLSRGNYTVNYFFLGDNSTNPSNGSATVTINAPTKTVLKVADKDINYRQGLKSVFIVRLLTEDGKAVKNQEIVFKVNGKTYRKTTDSKGYAQIFLSLKKGTYKVSYSFASTSPYLSSSGSHNVKVKSALSKGNGYWMWASGIKSVSLKTLKSKGTKQIFLNSYAFNLYGKKTVTSWIAKANKYGMKVHIWMQVFYEGKWVKPLKSDGSLNYGMMKKKVAKAVYYAKIKGVAGVHMDYVRFGGTAHKYDNAVKAINYFVKKVCMEVRKVRPNCILSAAVMPEPDSNTYYYGQDIPTMTKYLDVIVPMAYKGNYGKSTAWLKSVTQTLVSQSNGAQVWTGLQAYKSDSNVKKLTHSQLLKDAKACKSGGAKGVVLFRIGVTNLLNFNKV